MIDFSHAFQEHRAHGCTATRVMGPAFPLPEAEGVITYPPSRANVHVVVPLRVPRSSCPFNAFRFARGSSPPALLRACPSTPPAECRGPCHRGHPVTVPAVVGRELRGVPGCKAPAGPQAAPGTESGQSRVVRRQTLKSHCQAVLGNAPL